MIDFGFYNMDCMVGMKEFPDDYFDLAIVDPPYGSGGARSQTIHDSESGSHVITTDARFGGKGSVFEKYKKKVIIPSDNKIAHGAGHWHYSDVTWDIAPDEEYFNELFRVSQNQIIWGGNYFLLPPTRCFLIWQKTNVPENFSMAMAEYAWTSFNGNAKIFAFSAVGQPNRFHPTQKPVELYKWILNNFAKDGYKILDTHVGSASSLVACRECGFKYVGFEIDEEYYKLAKERLQKAENQLNIFDFLN